ncbi:hypothetical protein [Desulfobacter curvatus]|uniref:hypothetical protein n=1 Tax=Desulfobacter curvatus TaxID=2290 RepID=UPI0003616254|nr:hypothetical protein [Desulfobacter curvatus]
MSKTGSEIRHDAKERMKKYRTEMTEKGYTSTTIFLSQEHRAELKRLGDEYRLTRAEAAEHIFKIYLGSDNKYATQTHNTNINQQAETRTTIEALEARLKALEERDSKRAETIEEPTPAVEPPGAMPDRSDKDAYRTWLFNHIDALKKSGLTWVEITRQLNADGITSVSGKPFSRGAVDAFYKRKLAKKT